MKLMSRLLSATLAIALALVSTGLVHATSLTDFAENRVVDSVIRGQALAAPTTWHVALYTTCPTDAGGGIEVTGGAYARVAVAASLVAWAGTQGPGTTVASTGTGGLTSNNVAIAFPTPSAGWGTVVCWALVDAATAGNIWIYAALTVSRTILTGDGVSFAPGSATVQFD